MPSDYGANETPGDVCKRIFLRAVPHEAKVVVNYEVRPTGNGSDIKVGPNIVRGDYAIQSGIALIPKQKPQP